MTHHYDDIIDALLADHREVRGLLALFETTAPAQRGALFNQIVTELARHEAAEEALTHRTTRDETPGGQEVVEKLLQQESEAEQLLSDMEKMDPSSDDFLVSFRQLRADVLAHAEAEEAEEFPKLRALSAERRSEMADKFQQLKDKGPTRPHPHTPQTPEVRAAVGPIAGAFDRARDAAKKILSG